MFFLGHISNQLGWTPWGERFLLLLVFWLIPIHTKMSYFLGVGYFGGGECKGYCLGGFCHISNTLHMYTTPKQNSGISLLHEQGHTTKVLGKALG